MSAQVPFYDLHPQHSMIHEELKAAMEDVTRVSHFVLGEKVEEFESAYAAYIGVKHCIGVGNGLDAIKISLKVLGIGPGDEVLVPSNTYIATLLAVTDVGAVPVLIEPDPHTFNVDASVIESKISSRTKAIIPVHLYGRPVEMDEILRIAENHRLWVLEDNAQATGSSYKGKKTGGIGIINAHSFYPTKNLGALGDGGAITTNDDQLAKEARMLRNYGSTIKYHHDRIGYNSRLDELQAAFLTIKLRHLENWLNEKELLAEQYTQGLTGHSAIFTRPTLPEYMRHSNHLYVIRSSQRDRIANYLQERNIQTMIHYPIAVHRQEAYRSQFHGDYYPIADILSSEVLSLPLFPGMSRAQINGVIDALHSFKR